MKKYILIALVFIGTAAYAQNSNEPKLEPKGDLTLVTYFYDTTRVNGKSDNGKVSVTFDHVRVRTPIMCVSALQYSPSGSWSVTILRSTSKEVEAQSGTQPVASKSNSSSMPVFIRSNSRSHLQPRAIITTMVLVSRTPDLQLHSGA